MDTPRVPDSAKLRVHARVHTRWSDEDNQGVLNNAAYLTLFEEARHRYFGALGLLEGAKFPFLLGQTNVRFMAPGRGGAAVLVETGTTHVGESSILQAYRVRDAATGEIWAEAEALLVGWDNKKRAKRPWAPEFVSALRAYEQGGETALLPRR